MDGYQCIRFQGTCFFLWLTMTPPYPTCVNACNCFCWIRRPHFSTRISAAFFFLLRDPGSTSENVLMEPKGPMRFLVSVMKDTLKTIIWGQYDWIRCLRVLDRWRFVVLLLLLLLLLLLFFFCGMLHHHPGQTKKKHNHNPQRHTTATWPEENGWMMPYKLGPGNLDSWNSRRKDHDLDWSLVIHSYRCWTKNRGIFYPQNGWFIYFMENPMKIHDLQGVFPFFWKHPYTYQVIQPSWPFYSQTLEVTKPLKGPLNHPKRSLWITWYMIIYIYIIYIL